MGTVRSKRLEDFPRRPVVKNPPCNAGDMGLGFGLGAKTPHATGQLSPSVTTTEPRAKSRETVRSNKQPMGHSEEPVQPKKRSISKRPGAMVGRRAITS